MNQSVSLEPEAQLMERERLLELEMSGLGLERFRQALEDAKATGTETTTPGPKRVMQSAIEPVARAIDEYLAGQKTRTGTAREYLRKVKSDVVAFITAKVILDNVTSSLPRFKTAIAIGNALEDECRLAAFEEQQPARFQTIQSDLLRRTSNIDWRRAVLMHEMNKTDVEWQAWSEKDKIHIGQHCIHLFMETTGLVVEVSLQSKKMERARLLEASAGCLALITDRNSRCELLSPSLMPMLVQPKPWTAPQSGGYWFLPSPHPFIKAHHNGMLRELLNTPAMAGVYQAVNTLQETAWKINGPMLEVMQAVWDRSLPLGGLDFKNAQALPPCPACQQCVDAKLKNHACFDTDKDTHKEWKRSAAKVHASNGKARSKQLQVTKVLWVAEKFKGEAAIYFPTNLDFRGRAYALPMHLNPQGADWAKGLLTFAHGKPIADQRALNWLKIHGANTYGFDKASLDERSAWVDENKSAILASAQDPLGNTFWSDADKPWQFLAFCFEYAAFNAHGFGYVSHLPVALDGSCNGLQHFSAMLRDPIGGAAVNLLPSEKPNDIYQTVCDRLNEKLKADGSPMALAWLALNPDRKLTKRPVMTLPYGSTVYGCRVFVSEWLANHDHSWGSARSQQERYCTKLIWETIGEVVIAARSAMDWLQKAARVAAAEGKAVRWTTPDGLPVVQAYAEMESKRVCTRIGQATLKVSIQQPTGKLDKRRQANGISPNFVHSMDAAALRLYVLRARDKGISSFALVHDSYGTLAADTDMSAACLRDAFVSMYDGQNHLETLRTSLAASIVDAGKLPPVPLMGTLDLQKVRDAIYFFA